MCGEGGGNGFVTPSSRLRYGTRLLQEVGDVDVELAAPLDDANGAVLRMRLVDDVGADQDRNEFAGNDKWTTNKQNEKTHNGRGPVLLLAGFFFLFFSFAVEPHLLPQTIERVLQGQLF